MANEKRTPPTKELLTELYVTQNLSAYRMSQQLGYSFASIKRFLIQHELWDKEKAKTNQALGAKKAQEARALNRAKELLTKANYALVEVVDEPIHTTVDGGPGGRQDGLGSSLAIVPPGSLQPSEPSAYDRLSINQRRAVDIMSDVTNLPSYTDIAKRLGVSEETFLVYRKDANFQTALDEAQSPLFKSDVKTLYRASLTSKLKTGKDSKEDRLLAARIAGDAGPDSTLNTAVQVNIKGSGW